MAHLISEFKEEIKYANLTYINKLNNVMKILDIISNDLQHILYKQALNIVKAEVPKLVLNNSESALYVVKKVSSNLVLNKDIPRTNYDMLNIIVKCFDNYEEQLINKYNLMNDN